MSVAFAERNWGGKRVEQYRPTWDKVASGLMGTYSLALAGTVSRIDEGRSPEVTDAFSRAIAAKILTAPGQDLQEERCWYATADAMRKPLGAFGLSLGRNEKDGNVPWETELVMVSGITEFLAQRALINTARMMEDHETSELRFAYSDAQKLMQSGNYEEAVQLLSRAISPLMTADAEPIDRSNLEINWESDVYPQRAQFTEKGREEVKKLITLGDLPLRKRVILLAEDPFLGRVLAKMDPEMAANFPDWLFAQQIVNAAGQAADTHALQITGGRGRMQRLTHRFRSSKIENPRPPKPPSKRTLLLLGGMAVVLIGVQAACAALDDDDDSQPESNPMPPTTPTLNAAELPTIAATFPASASPALEATATLNFDAIIDAHIAQLPADLAAQLTNPIVRGEIDRIAQGDPTLATKLADDTANLNHALFGDPEHPVALRENTQVFGISNNPDLPDTGINDNQIAFEIINNNGTPGELPVGTWIFWSNGDQLQTDLSPEQARAYLLFAEPLPGTTLELRVHAGLNTVVNLDINGEIIRYLNESMQWVDKDGNLLNTTNTPSITPTINQQPVENATPATIEATAPPQLSQDSLNGNHEALNNQLIGEFMTNPQLFLNQIPPEDFYEADGNTLNPSFISTELYPSSSLPIMLNIITVTPILLDVSSDDTKAYLTLGALDKNGEPFIYILTTGFLNGNEYPTYGVTRSFRRGNTNGSPPLNFTSTAENYSITFAEIPNQNLADYLATELGKPIKLVANAITFENDSPDHGIPNMTQLEIDALARLTNPSLLDELIERYDGNTLSPQSGYIFNDMNESGEFNPENTPLVGTMEPILN